jgi:predicted ribonuclease YlaK
MVRFAEHAVILPVVVISELEKKRNDPEIGFFAREALRNLDQFRSEHERLDFPIVVGLGGTLTGDHGVGLLNRKWLREELGDTQWELQRKVKEVFDPQGILNPESWEGFHAIDRHHQE